MILRPVALDFLHIVPLTANCIKNADVKRVFAQQMLWHFHSHGSTFKIKVRYTLPLNTLLDFAYTNAINGD